jgi:hypothetical protein
MSHWAALAFRVPIVAFPCWTNKAKEISTHLPFSAGGQGKDGTNEGEENSSEEQGEEEEGTGGEIVKKRKKATSPAERKRRESLLPLEIISLL